MRYLFSSVSARIPPPGPSRSYLSVIPRQTKLDAVYSDFVHTAVTYGRTIISEYFLHEYMKSVRSVPHPSRAAAASLPDCRCYEFRADFPTEQHSRWGCSATRSVDSGIASLFKPVFSWGRLVVASGARGLLDRGGGGGGDAIGYGPKPNCS